MRKRRDFGKRREGSYINDMIKKKMTKEKMKALDLKMKEYHFKEITEGELVIQKMEIDVYITECEDFQKVFWRVLEVGEGGGYISYSVFD